jgi:hypothetical protein
MKNVVCSGKSSGNDENTKNYFGIILHFIGIYIKNSSRKRLFHRITGATINQNSVGGKP